MQKAHCYQCGEALTAMILPVSRREECPSCRAEVHVCRMCLHYRANRQQWCAEDRAEPPSSTERANFCDYYALNENAWSGQGENPDQASLDQLSALFDD